MGTQLVISDDILWGKLVKSWATGKNYIVVREECRSA